MYTSNNNNTINNQSSITQYSNDSTAFETISVIFPTFLLTTFSMNVVNLTDWKNKWHIFFWEFIVIIVPNILNFTILVPEIYNTIFLLLIINYGLCLLSDKRKTLVQGKVNKDRKNYVTNARATINLLSVIGILAVDFYVFPRRFTKNASYGFSLMDVGVGLYVYANGIVAPEIKGRRDTIIKTLKNVIPLFLLGTARFIATREINYHVPESEYGVHWNFFITLAATKLLSSLVLNYVDVKYAIYYALMVIVTHEILLQLGLAEFVFSNVPRDTFLTANREGIVSSSGYVGLYLFSVSVGAYIHKKPVELKFFIQLCSLSFTVLSVFLCLQFFFGTSRCLANSGYCFWILFIGIFMTALYYLCEVIQDRIFGKNKGIRTPFVFDAINFNGLAFFLISNLLTGFVNITIYTLRVRDFLALVILTVYMLINCSIICVLYVFNVRLKL